MPTYAQLQAESWWAREIQTPELDWLGDELCRRTRRPRNAFGTKGDNNHLRGAHRSQEWILRSRYATSRTYTVQSGLTADQQRHIAGIDFTPGSAAEMVAQCKRIYAAMRAGRLEEVREFYGNVDGDKVVDGWDNVRDRAASSDSSHLWHWHLSLDRRHCANKKLMERILAITLGDPTEEDVSAEDVQQGFYLAVMEAANPPAGDAGKRGRQTRDAIRAIVGMEATSPAELKAVLDGRDFTNEPAIVAGVLAGLSPASIAAAIPLDLADRVADELARRLATPAG